MALKFKKPASASAPSAANEDKPGVVSKGKIDLKKPASSGGSASKSSGGGVSFFKKGKAAHEAIQKEEAAAELRKQEQGKLWRFWMPSGETRQITFLDGDLDDDGMLDILMYHEHGVRVNGNWEQFVCTAETDQTQPCPICEKGERPSLVGVMTVIDHSEHKIKKGANAGKIITNQRKLFVAKMGTIRTLTTLAAKRGGLAGCLFDVSRGGDDDPNVGNLFDFTHKFDSAEEIANQFDLKVEECVPANYEEEIRYRSPEELIELGIGKAVSGPGTEKGSNLKDEL
jgi:hypothetical protein